MTTLRMNFTMWHRGTLSRLISGLWCIAALTLGTPAAQAQSNAEPTLEETPWATTRPQAMGGALSGLADSIDAPFYNPAGIGGLQQGSSKAPFIRQLDFPYAAGVANDSTMALNKQLDSSGALSDTSLAAPILDAYQGQHQYGRVSVMPNIVMGRFMMGVIQDTQMAALRTDDTNGLIDTHYRTVSGAGAGFSFTDNEERFSLGVFGTSLTRKVTRGQFTFDEINDPDQRKSAFSANSTTYSGMASHAGLLWRVAKNGAPTLSLSLRDVGNTHYKTSDGSAEDVVAEDATLGFSVSPRLGKWGILNYTVEGGRLRDKDTSLQKKMRTGLELQLGQTYGSRAPISIQSGYNSAGASYGLQLHIGIISLGAASFAEDIGSNNVRVIERRKAVHLRLNVADFE